MDRIEIYNRYIHTIDGFNILNQQNAKLNIEHVRRKRVDGYTYLIYRTLDTGILFATVNIDVHCDRHGEDETIKISVPTSVDDIPVISIVGIRLLGIKHSIYLDLSDNDLSNILYIDLEINNKKLMGIKFPSKSKRRLRPVSVNFHDLECNFSNESVLSMIKDIDFSSTISIDGLLSHSSIESFDFSQYDFRNLKNASFMFAECRNLKHIKGRIGCNKLCVQSMFLGCSNLESIGSEVFKGIPLDILQYTFSGCSKLRDVYLDGDNVGMHLNNFAIGTFCGCNKLNYDNIEGFMNGMFEIGTYFLKLFNGSYTTLNMCRLDVYPEQCNHIFEYVSANILNLSKMNLKSTNGSVMGILDIVFKQSNMQVRSVYAEFNNKYQLEHEYNIEDIPRVIVINSSVPVRDLDGDIFNVIDIRGHNEKELDQTLKRIMAFITSERYLVIV